MLKLYKYLLPDRVEILQNCLTRYTPPGALNEPFEMRLAPWFKSLFPPNAVHRYSGKIANVTKITEWMEKDFHKGLLVFCLTESKEREHEQEWRIFRMAKDAAEVKDPDAPYPRNQSLCQPSLLFHHGHIRHMSRLALNFS